MKNVNIFQVVVMGIFGFIALLALVLFSSFQGFSTGAEKIGAVSVWGTLPESEFNRALAELKQVRQEFANVTYTARPAQTFDRDLANAIASGSGPDLIVITQEDLLTAESKISLLPSSVLSERDFRNQFLTIGELFLVPGSGQYAIPFLVDPLVMFYNRPIIDSAGARPPTTWESVSALATVVNRQTDAQAITRSLIALGTYENIQHARGIISLLFMQMGYTIADRTNAGMRATLLSQQNAAFGSTAAESALNFYTEFANPAKTVYSWNRSLPDNRRLFITGDVALYLGFASERQAIAAENPNLDFDMAAAPMPGTATTRIAYGKVYGFALPRASKNSNGAVSVALAFSQPDIAGMFARAIGAAPAQRSALAPQAGDLYEPVFYPEAQVARGWLSPAPETTDRIFGTMIQNVASGRETVSAAISTANQSLDAAFR